MAGVAYKGGISQWLHGISCPVGIKTMTICHQGKFVVQGDVLGKILINLKVALTALNKVSAEKDARLSIQARTDMSCKSNNLSIILLLCDIAF